MKPLRAWLLWLAACLLLLPTLCSAQLLPASVPRCWPPGLNTSIPSSDWGTGFSRNGAWIWWVCAAAGGQPESLSLLVKDNTLTNAALGGRIDTVMGKADREQAAADSWKRNASLPLTDPRFDALMKDVVEDLDARGIVLERR